MSVLNFQVRARRAPTNRLHRPCFKGTVPAAVPVCFLLPEVVYCSTRNPSSTFSSSARQERPRIEVFVDGRGDTNSPLPSGNKFALPSCCLTPNCFRTTHPSTEWREFSLCGLLSSTSFPLLPSPCNPFLHSCPLSQQVSSLSPLIRFLRMRPPLREPWHFGDFFFFLAAVEMVDD